MRGHRGDLHHLGDQHRLGLFLAQLFLAAFIEPVWFGDMAETGRSCTQTFTCDSRKDDISLD